ncbi:hypothetical protein [Alcanivorax sp.]|uniref:hypothetical protein n=1 Tax=Alcanivorax sp. TaxID=1872427 RepID=UPI0025C31F55|nr:hypothetical protein [Alcanivorax sp.]
MGLVVAVVEFAGAVLRIGQWLRLDHSGQGLQEVANVALEDAQVQQGGSLSAALDHLESLQGLLLRCVAIWLILSALWIIVI